MEHKLVKAFLATLSMALLQALAPVCAGATATADERAAHTVVWPRPAGLEKDVGFWRDIYTTVSSSEGVIHDARQLDIVYETLRMPAGISARAADKQISSANKRYRAVLERLARSRTGELSETEARVLAMFPDDVSAKALRTAASRVRFQRGQSDRFRAGLKRSGVWLPYIHQQLRKRNLPQALAVLPHVESSFNAAAYSHAGAAGLWQITRATGRHYLRIDHVVDERLDPYMATEAALTILQQNYRSTGTWPLAITAYNHGPAGMRKAARKLETQDIETILREHRSRSFGFASRNFYVAFLAASEIVNRASDYFGEFDVAPPAVTRAVTLEEYIPVDALIEALKVDKALFKALNPSLRRMVWEGDKRVPKGFRLRLPLADADYAARLASVDSENRFAEQVRDDVYKVRQGDTLSGIGKRYGLSAAHIARVNGLRSKHSIRIGQVLRLPPSDKLSKRRKPVAAPQGSYVVVSGDTLSDIAGRHGVSERELAGLNSLSNRHRIFPGQVLIVAATTCTAATQLAGGRVAMTQGC